MCPSNIYQLPVTNKGFGPAAEVFTSEVQYPCSIAIQNQELAENVKIQVERDNTDNWTDYEQGQLLIGKRIKCRLAHRGTIKTIAIEVFFP